jgi:hypothetical protein
MQPTVAEESAKYHRDVPPERRDPRVDGLDQRIARAQEADRERNRARQAGESWADGKPAPLTHQQEAQQIVHALGLSNEAGSYRFVLEYLALRDRVAKLERFLGPAMEAASR